MGIAVPSQLRKATQPRNPSPPLPLLPPPPLTPRLAMASASTTPTPLPASSSRSEAPPSQTPQPRSSSHRRWSLHSRGCSSRYIRSCRSMLPPEFQAVALAHQQKGKREAEAEPWYGWRGYSGAPIAGGALVIGQNSVTPDYTPEQKGAAWGLNWGLVKREADSEADAYYGYGGYGLGYGGYGYGGLGYGYGKRSA